MKKRAKQLAMLGLAVTMVCGTQITTFASDAEGETPVAVETPSAETETPAPETATDEQTPEHEYGDLTISFENTNFDGTQDIVASVRYPDGVTDGGKGNHMVVATGGGYINDGKGGQVLGEFVPTDFGMQYVFHKEDIMRWNFTEGETYTIYVQVAHYYEKDGKGFEIPYDFTGTMTYFGGDTDNGGGTETPDPEKEGWIKTEEGWKYYEDGQKAVGWKGISGTWYYFNENGLMETGWVSVGGHWYYLNESGAMETGWASVGGYWYYLNADGTMETGWTSVGGHWYYLNADGIMATGWTSVGGHWYYLNADGTMETGWASVGGHWYYLNESGTMETGWVSVEGYWYYLNTDGTMASNQWIDGWYVDASGKML